MECRLLSYCAGWHHDCVADMQNLLRSGGQQAAWCSSTLPVLLQQGTTMLRSIPTHLTDAGLGRSADAVAAGVLLKYGCCKAAAAVMRFPGS